MTGEHTSIQTSELDSIIRRLGDLESEKYRLLERKAELEAKTGANGQRGRRRNKNPQPKRDKNRDRGYEREI